MTDNEYHQRVDALLLHLEELLDEVASVDLDYEYASGILTIDFPNQTKIIINKQPPNHQIWVATKFDGHHFDLHGEIWIDNRSGKEFWALLSEAASKQAGKPLSFTAP